MEKVSAKQARLISRTQWQIDRFTTQADQATSTEQARKLRLRAAKARQTLKEYQQRTQRRNVAISQ